MTELSTRYEAPEVERAWLLRWQERQSFKPESVAGEAKPFTVVIPPPNVTGILHMGHALNNTLQDVLVRHQRMRGRKALWVPGTDHAGIATQNVVEKALAKEGKKRQDVGREAFLAKTWEWKEKYGGTILDQLKSLGSSCDWDRCRFTMDAGLSRAVLHAFVELFNKDLIYRGERLINWCPRCETALSDEEAEVREESGQFVHLRYPVVGEAGRFVIVATTRPETMLGDTAVAVHPSDARYASLIGKRLQLPLTGRTIPVIADQHADPEKGSGAVKITPAHDFNDFAVGERHALPKIRIFDDRAKTTEAAGVYAGLDRFAARKRVLADLETQGLIERIEDKVVPLPRCYRCDTVVEPHLSKQWFVRMKPLLEPAAKVVREGKLRILPERYTQTYLDWVEQYRDWCISRQIWWGHRIPVWYDADDLPAASVAPLQLGARHPISGKPIVRQDPDVLDTWFSSQLWPFSVFNWPDATSDLQTFYPTDVLVTGRDIIYFWVARMVMCGIEFLKKPPFHTVYINGTILDEKGRRMSKSLGNGIDPLEMGAKYGTDAVRWTLVSLTTEGQDIKLSETRFEGGRNFVNKLWNASRFVLMNLEGFDTKKSPQQFPASEDQWIRGRVHALATEVSAALAAYRFHELTRLLYEFTWNTFCDWYLELAKSRLLDTSAEGQSSRREVQATLIHVLDTLLRLLHPVIPFVTEEIRSHLLVYVPNARTELMSDRWPEFAAPVDAANSTAERDIDCLIALVKTSRTVRDRMGLAKNQELRFVVRTGDAVLAGSLQRIRDRAMALGRLSALEAGEAIAKPAGSITVVEEGLEIFVPLSGVMDLELERARLRSELELLQGRIAASSKKLENQGFLAKAKPEVVEEERSRLEDLVDKAAKLAANLSDFG